MRKNLDRIENRLKQMNMKLKTWNANTKGRKNHDENDKNKD